MRKSYLMTTHILVASLLAVTPLFWFKSIQAAPLSSRAVTIASPLPSANTSHNFSFTLPSVSTIGSIEFEYCINTPFTGNPCDAPIGFDASGAVLDTQTGEIGFSIDASSTANRIVLTRAPGMTSAIPVTYSFSNIINQGTPNSTSYVRIATYTSSDGTGAFTDDGAVAYSTSRGISVSGYVPPYLTFCVGVVVALDCTITTGTQLNFGEFSKAEPRAVTSQFAVATNDFAGYSTFLAGTTMTSGNNIITALASPQSSQPGVSQFGVNLRANSSPAIGANTAGVGTGVPAPNFANPNQFYFNNGVIASSPKSSDFNAFTVSYIVNINDQQSPGIYTTTLTYIATAAF